jgi:integrase
VGQITVSFSGDVLALAGIMDRLAHALRGGVFPLSMGHPAPHLESVPITDTAPLGRIESTPGALAQAVEDWGNDMRRRRKRDRSIEAFTGTVRQAMKSEGWSGLESLTFDAVTKYLGARVESGQWSGSTHNRHLSAFRSLTSYLCVSGRLERDPLAGAGGIGDDEECGSRAATTPEVRAIVAMAYARQAADKRATGNRGLVWLAMALAGCRVSEPCGDESDTVPRGWRWGDLTLEESIPAICWSSEMHKARRRTLLPLHPDLAAGLRAHRETVPHAGEDPVFPIATTRAVFRADRERAGVAGTDREGLRFSPHSFRKWARTSLVEAGVQESLVNALMRHQISGLAARYTQPSLESMFQGVCALPRIIPENNFAGFIANVLESEPKSAIMNPATNEVHPPQHGTSGGRASLHEHSSLSASGADSLSPPVPCVVKSKPGHAKAPRNQATNAIDPKVPRLGSITGVDEIADWLEATARLLRSSHGNHP